MQRSFIKEQGTKFYNLQENIWSYRTSCGGVSGRLRQVSSYFFHLWNIEEKSHEITGGTERGETVMVDRAGEMAG